MSFRQTGLCQWLTPNPCVSSRLSASTSIDTTWWPGIIARPRTLGSPWENVSEDIKKKNNLIYAAKQNNSVSVPLQWCDITEMWECSPVTSEVLKQFKIFNYIICVSTFFLPQLAYITACFPVSKGMRSQNNETNTRRQLLAHRMTQLSLVI